MKLKLSILFTITALLSVHNLIAQNYVNNTGGDIFVSNGALLHINGGITNSGIAASITNNGTLQVKNADTPGNINLTNSSSMLGEGQYRLEGDWVNNANFISGGANNQSEVVFDGDNQKISGPVITSFYDLEMGNSATIKTLEINTRVKNTLNLNNNELQVGNYSLVVENPAVNAILYDNIFQDEGFVSTDLGGRLARFTNSSIEYLFPMGSGLGTKRYRKIEITPDGLAPDTFSVTFKNNDPTLDGFNKDNIDSQICAVNPSYYHIIQPSGNSTASIEYYFDPINDGANFQHISQWNIPQNNIWNNINQSIASVTAGNYLSIKLLNWSTYTNPEFILSLKQQSAPNITGPSFICYGLDSLIFNAIGSTAPYEWNFPPGVNILSNPDSSTVLVNWGYAADTVFVQGNATSLCPSSPGNFPVLASNLLNTNFTTDSNYTLAQQPVIFTDVSTSNINYWQWQFGDSTTSNEQNPIHIYAQPGEYTVIFTGKDSTGCGDTSMTTVFVDEYIEFPNVFSPNGDGLNDNFTIPFAVKDGEYLLSVYNRYGQLLFQSPSYQLTWDGTANSGQQAPDGTYYYKLDALTPEKKYNRAGYITLVR